MTDTNTVVVQCNLLIESLIDCDLESKIEAINEIRECLHSISPFISEPVDFVRWVKAETVGANDYNPNSVAPPEMELLELSILEDGYTQPIVSWNNGDGIEVVDGFHRNRVGKESEAVYKRIHGYLPVTIINKQREERNDRIASTIRHNRARGKHKVDAMSDIVIELKKRNWTDARIGKNLGMDQDEILRLCQISGLEEMFSDQEFSKSWDVEGVVTESDFEELTDDISQYGEDEFRVVHTGGEDRIFHQYEDWECYKAGFYATTKKDMTQEEGLEIYRAFLSNPKRFAATLKKLIKEWKKSCEHYLTNSSMNRIAWLGQAAACYAEGVPSTFRGGFSLLTEKEQDAANQVAFKYLNIWMKANKRDPLTFEEAYSTRQSDIY